MGAVMFDREHNSDSAQFVRQLEVTIQAIIAIFVTRKAIKPIRTLIVTGLFSPMALQPNAVHGLLILDEVSRSHTTTHYSR